MFKKVLFSLSIVTFLTACGSSSSNTINITIPSAEIDQAMKACQINGGLRQLRATKHKSVVKTQQLSAECKNGASFKLQQF